MLKVSTHTQGAHAHKSVRLLRCALYLVLLCVVSVIAHAQTAQPAIAKPAAPTATANDTKQTAPTSEPAAVAPVDELEQLRAQIKATSDESVRGQLQRELMARLAKSNEKTAALDELRLMLYEDRYDPPFFYNLGNTFVGLGDNSTAVDAYRKAISQKRGHYARALNNLGVILLRQGRWDEAYDALAGALAEEHNTYAEASYNLGRLYLLRGDADLAIREWQHTLALQPDHADAAAALARAYAEDGNARRGLAVLDAFTARSTRMGGSAPLPIVYARREIIEASGSDEQASANTHKPDAASVRSYSAPTVGHVADNRSTSNRPASSRATTLRALAVDSETYDVLQRARAAREAGAPEAAVKFYRSVLARQGGYFPPANLELAFALVNLKRNNEAIATLEALVARDGAHYPVAYYHLGRLYEQTDQLQRAADSFQRATELYGDANPQVLIDLSRVRDKLGDTAGALAAMESYVKAMAAEGATPDWAKEKLAQLRAKADASAKPPATKP
jgi:tetratricopeptide (TPR) repeat protein